MKARHITAVIILSIFTACFLWLRWKHDEPKRHSLKALQSLCTAIDSKSSAILDEIVLPRALTSRTAAELTEFFSKALGDEIPVDGIGALKKNASFGPLNELFSEEAARWAMQAGVNADDCVAFRMERNGIRAEVVLVLTGNQYRVVRCNNVKQMAAERRHS